MCAGPGSSTVGVTEIQHRMYHIRQVGCLESTWNLEQSAHGFQAVLLGVKMGSMLEASREACCDPALPPTLPERILCYDQYGKT